MDNFLLILRHTKEQLDHDLKYNGIINALQRMGYDVWYTYSDNGSIFLSDGKERRQIGKMNIKMRKFSRNTALYKAIRKYISNTDTVFGYCYMRLMPSTPGYIKMLKAIRSKGVRIAVEIPTYPNKSEGDTGKFLKRYVLRLLSRYDKKAARFIDVYLPMGEKTDEIYGRPAVNIENAIDFNLISQREYKPPHPKEVHLLAVAKMARWHGYDRVIDGLYTYYKDKPDIKVFFHMVGPEGDGTLKEYIRKINEYKLNQYVISEGPKYGHELNQYFDMADVAFATLGTHRKNISRISSLKVGEYMARGIPFLYELSECQVDETWDFCMSVPADDSPIDIHQLIAFSKKANSIENLPEVMRGIAVREFSWETQMQRMIDFFDQGKRKQI